MTSTTGAPTAERGRLGAIADLHDRGDAAQHRRSWLIPGAEELFRSLYTGLDTGQGTSFAICSSVSGEGKTTLTLGLATAIAQDLPDKRVVVVETDLWRAVLAKDFGLPVTPGLVDVLLDRQTIASALRPTALDNLSLLLAGKEPASPQRLLRSARMPEIIDTLRRTYDVVIVDTPAVLAHSEVALLTKMVEEVIFVVRTGVTPARELESAFGRLQGANVRGIIVNDSRSAVPSTIRKLVRI
jgi:capsular exopolysaccharide synthesis family protein